MRLPDLELLLCETKPELKIMCTNFRSLWLLGLLGGQEERIGTFHSVKSVADLKPGLACWTLHIWWWNFKPHLIYMLPTSPLPLLMTALLITSLRLINCCVLTLLLSPYQCSPYNKRQVLNSNSLSCVSCSYCSILVTHLQIVIMLPDLSNLG